MDINKIKEDIHKRRANHIREKDGDFSVNRANVQTIPGIISSRGCALAGSRGVVFGPIKDVANIIHGPIGCSFYSWDQRRNLADDSRLLKRCFSTDLKEKDIVFGGEKKLHSTIISVYEMYKPAAIAVYSTCPVGLIGDDIDAVCRKAQKLIECPVIPLHTEGFKGVSQSKGHKIASDTLTKYVVGTIEPDIITEYDVNIIGEYNIGGDAWELKKIFSKLGVRVHSVFTGDALYRELASSHRVRLNLIHCQRSITSLAKDMKSNFGIPYMDISMMGIEQTLKSLREIASFFGLQENAEKLINQEYNLIKEELAYYKAKFNNKIVGMYIGGSRSWHFIKPFEELGMKVVLTGSEFGHAVDYEKMFDRAKDGTLFIDDLNHYEMCDFIEKNKPDLFGSGIKEMYTIRSKGVPYLNLHSYGGGGPYVGFKGLINLARDIDRAFSIEDREIMIPLWERSE